MTATIPSDTHAVGDAGHTTDHNDIADVLALCAKALAELAGTTSSTNATNISAIQAQVAAGYAALLGMVNPMTTEGDIVIGGASGAAQRLGAGTDGYFLKSNGSGSLPSWAEGSGSGAGGAPTAWYNAVTGYSADNTGASDCHTDVQSMLTAAGDVDGPVVCYFPAGIYSHSQGWTVPPNVTILGDFITGNATIGSLTGTVFEPRATYTGTYVFYVPDVSHAITNGPVIRRVGINGAAHTSSSVDAIQFYGPTLSAVVDDVRIIYMTGWGLNFLIDATAGETTEAYPFGLEISNVYVDTCGQGGSAGGINAYWCEDSTFCNVYVIGNDGPGWVITGCDNTKFIACRSEWNGTYGFHITGDWSYASTGACQYIGCSTDRNTYDGVFIDATWTYGGDGTAPCPQMFTNLSTHRDGSGGGTTYAGLRTASTSLPVVVSGWANTCGDNDGGGGNFTPYFAASIAGVANVPVVVYGGYAWGVNAGVHTSGTTTDVAIHGYFSATGTITATNGYEPGAITT